MKPAPGRGTRRSALGVLVFAGLGAAFPAQAAAPEGSAKPKPPEGSAKPKAPEPAFFAEVMVLHATNGKKGIDPRIGAMPELAKPPFSSYESYALLDRARLPLLKETPRTLELPNGRVLETRLVEVLGKDALRLSARITQPNGKELLPLLAVRAKLGQAFIVAGPSYKQGILVLVIRAVQ